MKLFAFAATLAAALGAAAPALAADTWVGSADYGVEAVGPFNTYDFSSAGVLLLDPVTATVADGYYQSFVSQHLLDGQTVASPLLSANGYEITVVANFTSTQTSVSTYGQTFEVGAGSFALWLDTTPDRNFATDSGFANDRKILEGVVIGGAGSTVIVNNQQFGGGSLQLRVTSFDSTIFEPDSIGGGGSIFTLRLNAPVDSAFLTPITSVQGHAVGAGDLKFAADGSLTLTPVPEPESYAMMLAGLGLIGGIARRRLR